MFGLSITKILFTALVVFLVWHGFKWYARLQEDRIEKKASGGKVKSGGKAAIDAEEMVKCAVCGTFVASNGAVSCGKDDCPYTG